MTVSVEALNFEEVNVGDALPDVVKGPMTPLHIMRWSASMENWHRIHYDPPFATQHDGLPDIVVNGSWKQHVMCQLLKDWVAPAGRVWQLGFQYRSIDPVGTLITAFGEVTDKQPLDTFGVVTCSIGIRNDERVSTEGTAKVLLPLHDGPTLPTNISALVAEIANAQS